MAPRKDSAKPYRCEVCGKAYRTAGAAAGCEERDYDAAAEQRGAWIAGEQA